MKDKINLNGVNTKILAVVVLAVLAGGGMGFFGGMKYQESKSPAAKFGTFQGAGMRNGERTGNVQVKGGNGNGANFRPVAGDIISIDGESLTVKLSDGTSKIIVLSDSTLIGKFSEVGKEELTVGANVSIFGTQNSDGSVTAQNIQLGKMVVEAGGMPKE